MEEQKENELEQFMLDSTKKASNFPNFIKKYMSDFLIIIIAIVYVFYGLITIEESHRTILEILSTGAVSSAVGLLIKYTFSIKGISSGRNSDEYIKTHKKYTDNIESICDCIDKLDSFCDYKNYERLKKAQKKILNKNHMTYEKFINGEYYSLPQYKEAIKKINKIKIYELTSDNLTSAYSDNDQESNVLNKSVSKFLAKGWGTTLLFAVATLILFGMFQPGKGDLSYQNIIWASLQTVAFLALGSIKYFSSYNFMTMEMVDKINRMNQYIIEFKATLVNKPEIYEEAKENKEINQNECI